MGVSRREFPKMAAAVNPLLALIIYNDLYINQRLGLSFRKPQGWHYVSIKTFKAFCDEYSLASHNELLNEEMRDWTLPIVPVAKYPLDDRPGRPSWFMLKGTSWRQMIYYCLSCR
jgi:hypothetical protein